MISTLDDPPDPPSAIVAKHSAVTSAAMDAIVGRVLRRTRSLSMEIAACMPFDRHDRRDVTCWVKQTLDTALAFSESASHINCAEAMAWTVVQKKLLNGIRDADRKARFANGDRNDKQPRFVPVRDVPYDRRRELASSEPFHEICCGENVAAMVVSAIQQIQLNRRMRELSQLKCVARLGWEILNYAAVDPSIYRHFVESLELALASGCLLSPQGSTFLVHVLNQLDASSGNHRTDLQNVGISAPDRHAWSIFSLACTWPSQN